MRENTPLDTILAAKLFGGGSVTPASVATAIGSMTSAQSAQARSDLGAAGVYYPVIVTPSFVREIGEGGVYFEASYYEGVPYLNLLGTYGDEAVRLCNIQDPQELYDAVNKQYVDGVKVYVGLSNASITPLANRVYNCGTLTSLTISNPPATGKYSIIFFSGATATVVTGIDNFTVEANKRYRINVQDGYATFDSWPYTPA